MTEQAPAGWYPDGQGSDRYWDGTVWTDQVRALVVSEVPKKAGAFSKLGTAVKNAAVEKKVAREEITRKQAEDALAAGSLITSGVFGTSTVEIYENGYVRVASWGEGGSGSGSGSGPKAVDKKTPYERLRSVKFTQPEGENSGSSSALEGAVGPAMAKLMKGGKGLMKASAPGMAVAGIAHVASNSARKSFLTIATDQNIHTLTNQTTNSLGLKSSNKAHNDVARALAEAANAVLGVVDAEPRPDVDRSAIVAAPDPVGAVGPATPPSLSDRLRELAELHADGILSEEEFTSAKAKLLGGL
jgi:hypothetical protein